jgi:hypothetical protein
MRSGMRDVGKLIHAPKDGHKDKTAIAEWIQRE